MSLLDYFSRSKTDINSAILAKNRLQIIVAHERNMRNNTCNYLPQLKRDVIEAVRKHVAVTYDQVNVRFVQRDDSRSALELIVTLAE